MATPNQHHQPLRLYIRYDGFLLASQLGEVLTLFDRLYTVLYAALRRQGVRDIDFSGRLRLNRIQTVDSIYMELMEGVRTVLQSGSPTLQATAALGVMSVIATMLVKVAKGIAETRKLWHEGTKLKDEVEQAKLEKERTRRSAEDVDAWTLSGTNLEEQLRAVPMEARRAATEYAFQIVNLLEYAPNITYVTVNDVVLLEKNGSPPRVRG